MDAQYFTALQCVVYLIKSGDKYSWAPVSETKIFIGELTMQRWIKQVFNVSDHEILEDTLKNYKMTRVKVNGHLVVARKSTDLVEMKTKQDQSPQVLKLTESESGAWNDAKFASLFHSIADQKSGDCVLSAKEFILYWKYLCKLGIVVNHK